MTLLPNMFAMMKDLPPMVKSLAYLVILHAREPGNKVIESFSKSGRRLLVIYSFLLLLSIVLATFKPKFYLCCLCYYIGRTALIRVRYKKER